MRDPASGKVEMQGLPEFMQKYMSTFSDEEIAANPRCILDVILRTEEGATNAAPEAEAAPE